MTTQNIAYGSYTAMTVTNLQSLASSATAGWRSDRVDNMTTTKALDYEINIRLTTANTAAANDKCVYVLIVPWIYDGSTWQCGADQGTATLPTSSEGTTTIANPNNLKPLDRINYTTTQQPLNGQFFLSTAFNGGVPDGFSIILINFTGAALSTGCVVSYKPITTTSA